MKRSPLTILYVCSFTFALGLGGWVVPGTTRAQCDGPLDAAADATDFFPATFVNEADLPATECPALCKKWVTLCKGLATDAASCQRRFLTLVARQGRAECGTQPAPQRQACLADIRAEVQFLSGEVSSDLESARAACEGNEDDCLMQCP